MNNPLSLRRKDWSSQRSI